MTAKAHAYLDYNATTPVLEEVVLAVTAALGNFGNPSSVHGPGRHARAAVEEAREAIAALVDAPAQRVIFTSGGTEANALAMRGLAAAAGCSGVLASATEHPSIMAHVAEQDRIAVDRNGIVDLDALERALKQRAAPVLVAVMFANNETGVLQPVAEAVALARKYGALIHCDAVQALGKTVLSMRTLGLDSVSLSAHKFGGVKGAGVLALRGGVEIAADMLGGGQEHRRRAGTENVSGIVGMGAAARCAERLLVDAPRVLDLRDELEAAVESEAPQARIFGRDKPRLGNTSCILLPGVSSETQVMRLDLAGVAVSAGSACSSGRIAPSHVLLAMGVAPNEAKSAIRVSLGWETTRADISRFLEVWLPLAAKFRDS
ncbi:MAG: cysteine desulfurase [Rhodospirillaceae bacterium]|nr:cysteine desulfurase [Rhodospirillaceae bacterium]